MDRGDATELVNGLPLLRPMLAVNGELPASAVQAQWAFEMKWDGVRALAYVVGTELRLFARSGREITTIYPELAPLAAEVPGTDAIVDGEIVAFDADGRPSFAALQTRMHGLERGVRPVPIAFFAFDLLHLNGSSLLGRPYAERRALLETLELAGPNWQTPPTFEGLGDAALETSRSQGLEGVVAKRLDSHYEPGRRGPYWIKVKNVRTQSVVIGGWRTGKDSRASTFGSLLCGVHEDDGVLRYVGRVGSGFGWEALRWFSRRFTELARDTSPFDDSVPYEDTRDAHWVEPVLVGEVVFAGWTPDGRLWHPRWHGLRDDLDPQTIVRES